jgi:hypothetical protein
LGLFDDERTALHQPAAQLFNRLLRPGFGLGLDESKAARTTGLPIHGHADAADFDLLREKDLFQLLLVDVVGEVPYEKARSHKLLPLLLSSHCSR